MSNSIRYKYDLEFALFKVHSHLIMALKTFERLDIEDAKKKLAAGFNNLIEVERLALNYKLDDVKYGELIRTEITFAQRLEELFQSISKKRGNEYLIDHKGKIHSVNVALWDSIIKLIREIIL